MLRALEKKIGQLEADKALAESRLREMERKLFEKKKVNVGKILSEEELKILASEYAGAFSFKKLFYYMFKKKKPIKVSSFDRKVDFGDFDDFVLLKDGRFAIKIKQSPTPIITGRDAKTLFFFYSGLANSVKSHFIPIPLTASGEYVENLLVEEVPDVVEVNGKIIPREDYKKPLWEFIAQKNRLISELNEKLEIMTEQAFKEHEKYLDMKRKYEAAVTRAEVAEGLAEKINREYQELRIRYDELVKENALLEHAKGIDEKFIHQLWKARDDWMEKVREIFPKDVSEKEMEKFKLLFDYQTRQILKLSEVMEKAKLPPAETPPAQSPPQRGVGK